MQPIRCNQTSLFQWLAANSFKCMPVLIASCSHQHAGILQPSFPDMAQQAINVSGLQVALSAHAMHLQPHSTEPEGLAEQEMSVGETPEIM